MNFITHLDTPVSSVESTKSSLGSCMSYLNQSETLSENGQLSYPWESTSAEELTSNNNMACITSRQAPLSSKYETNNTMALMTSLDAPLSPAWPSTLSSEDFPPPSPKPKRTFPPRQIPYPWSLARSDECKTIKENDHFPFLKLPMELRHMIYKLHLSKGGDFDAIPMFLHRRPVIGVNLLATCKQIYVEAVQHVYLGRTWNIGQEWTHPFLPLTTLALFDDSYYYEAMNDRALARIEHLRITIAVPSRNTLAKAELILMPQLKKMQALRTLDVSFYLCGCSGLGQIRGSTLDKSLVSQIFTLTDDKRFEISGISMPTDLRKQLRINVTWGHWHESALMAPHCTLFDPTEKRL